MFAMATDLGAGTAGIVTAAQLRLAGAEHDTVRQALERHWQAPVRGVYVPHGAGLTDVELAHVAVAHAGPEAVISGLVAARTLGMRWLPDDVPGALVLIPPDVRRVGSEGVILVRRCGALASCVTQAWEGLRRASPAQVVVDSSRQLLAVRRAAVAKRWVEERGGWFEQRCLREVRGVVLGAVADGLCSATEVQDLVESGPIRDSALLRRACGDALRGAASPPEAELVDHLLEYGIPFACNVEVWDGDVLIAILDVLLVGTGVAAELDSKEAHERPDRLDATLRRHARVESRGLALRHVTPTRYRDHPAAFHAELFATAQERLARGLGDPPGLRLVPRGPVMRGPSISNPPYRLGARALSTAA
ncbi:MAG: hypothetical protein JWM40_2763 [Frankiales bacterium]|nr:hypothetical protein [Frankiales bacterium]